MVELSSLPIALSVAALFLAIFAAFFYWAARHIRPLHIRRFDTNPILAPDPRHWWESEAVFNPAAVVYRDEVHLLYRALGRDGISRFGYAKSSDGINFERYPNPAYEPGKDILPDPRKKLSYETLTYNTNLYASGGGWGGSEDPRAVIMDGRLFVTFTTFQNWGSVRMSLISLAVTELDKHQFNWSKSSYLSAPNEVQKNWILFPEKINGKFAVLHNISPVEVAYVDDLAALEQDGYIKSTFNRKETPGRWDAVVRGAGTPPIKTSAGWLLFYHGFDPHRGAGYNVGAMLLDLQEPTKILHRTNHPILTPEAWYENEWKAGVVYASGAVVFKDELILYYGGGDKYVAAAKGNFDHFVDDLVHDRETKLVPLSYT